MNLVRPPTGKFFSFVAKNKRALSDYFDAVYQMSRMMANVTINDVTVKVPITYTGRQAEFNIDLGTITSGISSIEHPFKISASDTAGSVSVLYGTVMDALPTNVGSDIALSNGTETLYIDVEIDIYGVFVDATLSHATTGQPADSDYHAYITIGTVVVSGGVVGTISQAATHSLRLAVCGRVVSAGPTLDTAGTYDFRGF